MLSREQVLDLFKVDLETGRLFWRHPPYNHPRLEGSEAGGARANRSKSYWVIKIGRIAFKRARLIFLVAHGRWPEPCVDHINGNSVDDRLANLREATVTENAWNHKHRARSANLPMGVRRLNGSGRYQARISVNKHQIHLGAFDTPEEAHSVYLNKRKEYFGEFA